MVNNKIDTVPQPLVDSGVKAYRDYDEDKNRNTIGTYMEERIARVIYSIIHTQNTGQIPHITSDKAHLIPDDLMGGCVIVNEKYNIDINRDTVGTYTDERVARIVDTIMKWQIAN